MKAAVVINAGLGDAILLLPLIKALRRAGRCVTGIFQSAYVSQTVFEGMNLLDESIHWTPSLSATLEGVIKHFKGFDEIYLNHLAATPLNLLAARMMGSKILTNLIGRRKCLLKGCSHTLLKPMPGVHQAVANLQLFDPKARSLSADAMFYPRQALNRRFAHPLPEALGLKLEPPYVAVQISAANNILQHKTWPLNHWIEWLKLASARYPMYQWVLLGEPSERNLGEQLIAQKLPRVLSLIGDTSLSQLMQILWKANFLVGLDSGLLHLAVALGLPTFTLWGGSDSRLYGYEWLDPVRHRALSANLPCAPCNSWLQPNQTRVTNPRECPDFACMKTLQPRAVFQQFQHFLAGLD